MHPRRLRHTWLDEILALSSIAGTHPHSAYCAFVHGVVPKWNYVMRMIESVSCLFQLQPLEDVTHQHFIPAGTLQYCKLERDLLYLYHVDLEVFPPKLAITSFLHQCSFDIHEFSVYLFNPSNVISIR